MCINVGVIEKLTFSSICQSRVSSLCCIIRTTGKETQYNHNIFK